MNTALLVVDVQRDFCNGGALPAFDTASLLGPLASFITRNRELGIRVIFTQDWHPKDHSSFKEYGGPWPAHCVAESPGAELMSELSFRPDDWIIRKGTSCTQNGYSAFDDTGLAMKLRAFGFGMIGVCGIATEYCVRATVIDALQAHFRTVLIADLIRPVASEASQGVVEKLRAANVSISNSIAWLELRAITGGN